MKLFCVADIHGCDKALIALMVKIEAVRKGEPAKIVFLGDYIDRGPDSAAVVQHLIDLRDSKAHPEVEYVFLTGNHEDLLLGALSGDNNYIATFYGNGGESTMNSYSDKEYTLNDHVKNFFLKLEDCHQHGDYVLVHAGIDPEYDLEHQNKEVLIWARDFNRYDGYYKNNYFVVHGHTPVEKYTLYENQLNIDTACVFGGTLTCAWFDDDNPRVPNFISVKNHLKEEK